MEWVYDALGRKTQEKKTTSSTVYTIGYTYDADGNVTQITYPSGRTVTLSRNAIGQVSGVTTKKDSGSPSVTLASSVTYLPFGPLTGLTYGNGLVLTKTFTQDYLINALQVQDTSTSTTIVNRTHAFGDNVNLTGITDSLNSSRSESYVYTTNNKLQEGDGIWGTLTWTYDGVGNRSSEVLSSGSTTTNTYNYPGSSNLLTNITQSATTVRSFTYDGAGNMTADTRGSTAYNYTYNNRARLSEISVGTTVKADYVYDGLERLASRTTQNMTPSGTTHYVYDQAGHLLAESTDTGQTVREYVWLDDMPLAVVADIDTMTPHLYFVHADHLDRPIKMTDGTEAIVWDAIYNPFGDVNSISGSASNNLRFPGQYFLIESGLHYNWYRHYDPPLGRYVQPDPLGFVDGPGIYGYADGSPASDIDPSGLNCAAVGNTVTCTPPEGKKVSFPRPQGWPDTIDDRDRNYHNYNIQVGAPCTSPEDLLKGIVQNPTPGHPHPATSEGTPNNATPNALSWFKNSPVISYAMSNGTVVNVTLPGHPLFPGYVERDVSASGLGAIANNYGEGIGWLQGPRDPFAGFINGVWNSQTQEIISGLPKRCGCK